MKKTLTKKTLKKRPGFTMVELMAALVIVGILAAVSVPIYRSNAKAAVRSEAIATLGAIRAAERTYKVEHSTYAAVTSGNLSTVLDVEVEDAQYFDKLCYTVTVPAGAATFSAIATNIAGNTAPGKTDVNGYWAVGSVVATMDQTGTITTP